MKLNPQITFEEAIIKTKMASPCAPCNFLSPVGNPGKDSHHSVSCCGAAIDSKSESVTDPLAMSKRRLP